MRTRDPRSVGAPVRPSVDLLRTSRTFALDDGRIVVIDGTALTLGHRLKPRGKVPDIRDGTPEAREKALGYLAAADDPMAPSAVYRFASWERDHAVYWPVEGAGELPNLRIQAKYDPPTVVRVFPRSDDSCVAVEEVEGEPAYVVVPFGGWAMHEDLARRIRAYSGVAVSQPSG